MNDAQCVCVNKYVYFMRLSNPSQRGISDEKAKKWENYRVLCSKKGKKFQWSPLWIIFKGKIKIAHLLPEQSAHQDDQFLQT